MQIVNEIEHEDGSLTLVFDNLAHREFILFFREGRKLMPDCYDERELVAAGILNTIMSAAKEVVGEY